VRQCTYLHVMPGFQQARTPWTQVTGSSLKVCDNFQQHGYILKLVWVNCIKLCV